MEHTRNTDKEQLLKLFREIHEDYQPDMKKVDEKVIQRLWNEQQFFRTDMTSVDGKDIRVLKPGVWNQHNDGPDFMHAEIEINKNLHVGDVEIHRHASEWYEHKHYLNSRYNRVILHAVCFDDGFNLRTRLQNGKRVPTLELLKYLAVETGNFFDRLRPETDVTAEIACRITGKPLDIEGLGNVFDTLGHQRFFQKMESIRLLRTRLDFEQLLYEGIMEALGYSQNSKPLRELAQHVPFAALDQKPEPEIQATLFGVAGLLPSQRETRLPPEVTADPNVQTLEDHWRASPFAKQPEKMQATQWYFKTRHLNQPTRRIAAMSQLIHRAQGSLMMYFLPTCEKAAAAETPKALRAVENELREKLTLKPTGYWREHANFGTGGARDTGLIGKQRALDIIINKILPTAYVWAVEADSQNLQDGILRLYRNASKSDGNQIIRTVDAQLFTGTQLPKHLKRTAKTEQGIIQLHKNYCADRLCDLCPILEHGAVSLEEA